MTVLVNTLTRCAGNNHYTINLTVGGVTLDIHATAGEMAVDFATIEDAIEAAKARFRSAIKEANAGNFTQSRAALEGKTFKL